MRQLLPQRDLTDYKSSNEDAATSPNLSTATTSPNHFLWFKPIRSLYFTVVHITFILARPSFSRHTSRPQDFGLGISKSKVPLEKKSRSISLGLDQYHYFSYQQYCNI